MSEGSGAFQETPPHNLYEQIVLSAPGAEIRQPNHYELPSELDLNSIPEKQRAGFEKVLNSMRTYLTYPSIYDHFSDHTARRAWRKEQEAKVRNKYGNNAAEKLYQIMHNNKISSNSISQWYTPLSLFYEYIPQDMVNKLTSTVRDKIMIRETEDPNKWDSLPKEAKFKTVDDISDSLSKIITHFGAKVTASV